MPEQTITQDDIEQAESFGGLGPAYFATRRHVEAAVAGLPESANQEVLEAIKAACAALYEQALGKFQDSLFFDAESNLHQKMHDTIDGTIEALLSGEPWALKRYCLDDRYMQQRPAILAAIAEHCGDEVAKQRIADLEAELKRVNDQYQRSLDYAGR